MITFTVKYVERTTQPDTNKQHKTDNAICCIGKCQGKIDKNVNDKD